MSARLATPEDDALLSSIVLHPAVHASNGGGPFDPTQYTRHPKSFAVIVEGGCFLADALEQGAYAIHTNFLPEARGVNAVRASRQALHLAFTGTDAEALYTKVDASNLHTLWFAHAMGFQDTYHHSGTQFMRLDIDDWIVADAVCLETGADFHRAIETHGLLTHDEDPVHDAFVGAARAMVEAIQYEKAERIYGRWARSAGYQPLTFISAEPVLIDIGSCVLRVQDGSFIVQEK